MFGGCQFKFFTLTEEIYGAQRSYSAKKSLTDPYLGVLNKNSTLNSIEIKTCQMLQGFDIVQQG